MKKNKIYYMVSALIFAAAALVFGLEYVDKIPAFFAGLGLPELLVLSATVIAVHLLRGFRQYMVLYGDPVSIGSFAREYSKVTVVGVLIPFKLGDIYRAYSYGHLVHNYYHGIVAVIVDRFVDTLAVVFLMALVYLLGSLGFSWIFWLLCLFLVVCLLAYWLFPGMYQYWKRYFLKAKATKRHNRILYALETADKIYEQIHRLVRGKFAILFSLSLLAWMVEMGGFLLFAKISDAIFVWALPRMISDYFGGALFGAESAFLARFVCISLVCLVLLYLLLTLLQHHKRRKKQ